MVSLNETNDMDSFQQMLSNLDSFTDCFDFNTLNDIDSIQIPNNENDNFFDFMSNSAFIEADNSYLIVDSDSSPNYSVNSMLSATLSPSSSNDLKDTIETNQLTQTFQIDPISIFLTESNDDKMKITSEIILNFDQIESESCLKRIEQEIENVKETFKIMIDSKRETVVEMHEQITSDEYSSEDEMSQSSNGKKMSSILTEEEKSLFIKEGHKLPSRLPLTKNEEKILKLVRRKIRNKKSAHVSRERKKKYVDGLEKRVEMTTKDNHQLMKQVKLLKNENQQLVSKLKSMQTFLSEILNKNKKASTAVLFVSFLVTFCVYPFMNADSDTDSSLRSVPYKGFSRALLQSNEFNLSILKSSEYNSTQPYDLIYNYYKKRFDF